MPSSQKNFAGAFCQFWASPEKEPYFSQALFLAAKMSLSPALLWLQVLLQALLLPPKLEAKLAELAIASCLEQTQ